MHREPGTDQKDYFEFKSVCLNLLAFSNINFRFYANVKVTEVWNPWEWTNVPKARPVHLHALYYVIKLSQGGRQGYIPHAPKWPCPQCPTYSKAALACNLIYIFKTAENFYALSVYEVAFYIKSQLSIKTTHELAISIDLILQMVNRKFKEVIWLP